MKKTNLNRLVAILTVMLFAAAAYFSISALANNEPAIIISETEGKPGDTVTITVSLRNNPGIIAARLSLTYA